MQSTHLLGVSEPGWRPQPVRGGAFLPPLPPGGRRPQPHRRQPQGGPVPGRQPRRARPQVRRQPQPQHPLQARHLRRPRRRQRSLRTQS
jgi:hypothetical protein